MGAELRIAKPSMSRLLGRVLAEPELMPAVQALPAASLVKVVDRLGVEDAGEIIAFATDAQLNQVFDEVLWVAGEGDVEERFSAEHFALWLAVLSEAGDEAVAQRLSAMPLELLVLGVQRLAVVINLDTLSRTPEADSTDTDKALESYVNEEWEEFALSARDPMTWDALWNALLSLDKDHHELLREVLTRCAYVTEAQLEESDGLSTLLAEAAQLEEDALGGRDERRAADGYVSTADATAFLRLGDLEVEPGPRDAITAAYFRRVDPSGRAAGPTQAATPPGSMRELAPILGELVTEPNDGEHAGLLREATDGPSGLRGWMRAQDDTRGSEAQEELAYLANVLLAAGKRHGGIRPLQAVTLAVELVEVGVAVQSPRHAGIDAVRQVPLERLFLAGLTALRRGDARLAGEGPPDWLLDARL